MRYLHLSNLSLMYFKTRTPKGDGNSRLHRRFIRQGRSFQNTNPERGRKRYGLRWADKGGYIIFQNTNPERGRKLNHEGTNSVAVGSLFQNTNPERGRKQAVGFLQRLACLVHFKTRTPKGDGNPYLHSLYIPLRLISKHEPRKGTETSSGVMSSQSSGNGISKHEPRKGTETLCLAETVGVPCKVFQNTNPERGRKRLFNTLLVNTFYFKTRTPKGDGNSRRPHALGALVQKISKHEPRKGTETRRIFAFRARVSNFKTRTPKGDGNGVMSFRAMLEVDVEFQNTNPERGRKLMQASMYKKAAKKFQNTNPERGRKPVRRNRGFFLGVRKFQNTNPERGRKLRAISAIFKLQFEAFQNTNPERGRK